jgi:hypothetical protein
MEIAVASELLADQRRADHRAIAIDQATLGALRKERDRNTGHGQRIDGQQRERDRTKKPIPMASMTMSSIEELLALRQLPR